MPQFVQNWIFRTAAGIVLVLLTYLGLVELQKYRNKNIESVCGNDKELILIKSDSVVGTVYLCQPYSLYRVNPI